jgi:hypothetical protein
LFGLAVKSVASFFKNSTQKQPTYLAGVMIVEAIFLR